MYKIGVASTVNVRPGKKFLPVKNALAYFTINDAKVLYKIGITSIANVRLAWKYLL